MEKRKIKDLCKAVSSNLQINKLENNIGDYPLYGASGLVKGLDFYKIDKPYVSIVKDGAGVGRISFHEGKSSIVGTMQAFLNNDDVDLKFFYYALKSQHLDSSKNGSTIPHIYFKNYGENEINFYPIEIQRKISQHLGAIDASLESKKRQAILLDELIKSRFIEQFEKYSKIELHTISKITMGQSPDSSSYNDDGNGVPFFQGKGDYGDKYTIVKHYTTSPKKIAKKDSVLMSVRAPVGPVNIANVNCCIGRGLCSIDAVKGLTNNEFIYNALNAMQDEISKKGNGSTFNAINKDDVYKLRIPNAPINEQDEFSEFVKLIDKSKFVVQQQIKDLQELLDKKMDEYFSE